MFPHFSLLSPAMWTTPSMMCFRWWAMPTAPCRMTRGAVSSCVKALKRSVIGNRTFEQILKSFFFKLSLINFSVLSASCFCNKLEPHRILFLVFAIAGDYMSSHTLVVFLHALLTALSMWRGMSHSCFVFYDTVF